VLRHTAAGLLLGNRNWFGRFPPKGRGYARTL